MKKFTVAILVVLLLPATLFAGVSLGATLQYGNGSVGDFNTIVEEGSIEFSKISFGMDARFRIAVAELDAQLVYQPVTDGFSIGGLVTAGVSFDIANLVRLGVGLGYDMAYIKSGDTQGFYVGGYSLNKKSLGDATLNYRVTADVLLGSVSVGAFYKIPTNGYHFSEAGDLAKLAPQFDKGTVGASVLYRF